MVLQMRFQICGLFSCFLCFFAAMGSQYKPYLVGNPQTCRAFLEVPALVYRNDTEYIRHLDEDIENTFDPAHNVYFSQGEAVRWVLQDKSGRWVGRVAAFFTLSSDGNTRQGGMGFFECIADQQAAFQLFDLAAGWLKEKGCTWMDGPVNFGDRDSFWGLLVEGFKFPAYRENYNPVYYRDYFEAYGFETVIVQQTSEIDRSSFNADRFGKLADRVFSNPKYTYKHYDWSNWEQFAEDFVAIYNQAWAHHANFLPMTADKVRMHLRKMKPILIPEYNWFVYADGEPAGFYINVLDVNRIFKHVNGKLDLLGKLKFLWYRRKVSRLRGVIFGIIPRYHNLGLETGLIMKLREYVLKSNRIQSSELAWIGDFNPKMLSMLSSLGARTVKVHNTYRKQL
jgi:hypothetical protein